MDEDSKIDIKKIEKEIENLLKQHKLYWYDFNVTIKNAKIIEEYFGKIYTVELKPCPKNQFCDVTIDLTKLIK
jgi:hypothetical protein